jgi:uncharacterized protein YkwD
MKYYKILSLKISQFQLPFFLLFIPSLVFSQTDQVYSIAEGEKVTEIYFHQMLNEYRVEKKKDSLEWRNTLQISAMNHSTWMMNSNKITHKETSGDSIFTGKTVNDRINFVTNRSDELYCGENILYFPFDLSIEGAMSDEEAWLIADLAFENWKSLKGHNKNMLHHYLLHGAAFKYANGFIWATNVFSCEGE